MIYNYQTNDTCATQIEFELQENKVHNVKFTGGCNGNLKAIPVLLEGLPAEEVIAKLSNITCGRRSTSCTAQLTKALQKALDGEI